MLRLSSSLVFLSLAPAVQAHDTQIFDVSEGEDWCSVINTVAVPGDIVRLGPGDYPGPCLIDRTPPEEQDEYTMVMSLNMDKPARIVYDGESDSLVQVLGEQIMLLSLVFEDLPEDVPAVEVLGQREIWVRYSRFENLDGTALRVSAPVEGLHLVDNVFDQVGKAFELELGQGQGETHLDLGDNLILEAAVAAEVQGDWRGWIRDNVALDVGQGFLVGEGAHSEDLLVEGNWIRSPGTAFRLAQGPLVLRNNIVQSGGSAWDLGSEAESLQTSSILGNSFISSHSEAFVLRGSESDLYMANNLSLVPLPEVTGTLAESNLLCGSEGDCWEANASGAFYPPKGAEGIGAGLSHPDLAEDFCGRPRGEAPSLGALEPACPQDPTQFEEDFKSTYFCTFAKVDGSGSCESIEDSGIENSEDGKPCACRSSTADGPGALLLGLALVFWRRRLEV